MYDEMWINFFFGLLDSWEMDFFGFFFLKSNYKQHKIKSHAQTNVEVHDIDWPHNTDTIHFHQMNKATDA